MPPSARKPAAAKQAEAKAELDLQSGEVDVIGVVSRDVDGNPISGVGFVLQVPEDPTDDELAAAWNNNGEMPPKGQTYAYVSRTF